MANIFEVLQAPHESLRQRCSEVTEFDGLLGELLDDMVATMRANSDVGLAANQVGVSQRVLVARTVRWGLLEIVNPVVLSEMGAVTMNEGCLSVNAGKRNGRVKRSRCIKLRFQDRCGASKTVNLADLDAVIVQHEIDHLNGVLFTDKVEVAP